MENGPENKDEEPYLTYIVNHQIPYYQNGWANNHQYGPLMMPPPTQKIMINDSIAPIPKIISPSELNQKTIYHINTYPQHMSNPFNLHSFYHTYNPNMAHITGTSPVHSASLSSHPFAGSGMIMPF